MSIGVNASEQTRKSINLFKMTCGKIKPPQTCQANMFGRHIWRFIRPSLSNPEIAFRLTGPAVMARNGRIAIFLSCLFTTEVVNCQTLDQAEANLLKGSCNVLQGITANDQTDFFNHAGPQLKNLCDPATGGGVSPGGVTASSGGGAASTQTQFVAIARRLAKAHGAADNKAGGGAGDENNFDLGRGLNLFVSGQFEGLDRVSTVYETGYKSNVNGVTSGADYRFSDWFVGGLAVNYNHWSGSFNNAGGFQTDTLDPMLYASIIPAENFFIDVLAEYGRQWRNRDRFTSFTDSQHILHTANGFASSDYQSDRYGANALMGYDYSIGPFTIGPRGRFRYSELNTGSYTESGNTGLELRLLNDRVTSVQTALGLQASAAFGTDFGVVAPQITADWTHEFQNNQRLISAQFAQDGRANPLTFQYQSDVPVRNFFHVGTGVSLILPHGFQPFMNFEALLGNSQFSNFTGTAGVRLEL